MYGGGGGGGTRDAKNTNTNTQRETIRLVDRMREQGQQRNANQQQKGKRRGTEQREDGTTHAAECSGDDDDIENAQQSETSGGGRAQGKTQGGEHNIDEAQEAGASTSAAAPAGEQEVHAQAEVKQDNDWRQYKCRPDIVGRFGRIEFFDLTQGVDVEALERAARERHEAEAAQRGELRRKRQQALYSHALDACMPTATLSSGYKIPLIGLGTWKTETTGDAARPNVVKSSVECAIKAGYRHIDCAAYYDNEGEVGAAFKTVFAHGVVSRGDIFVTSKLWIADHAKDRVRPACEKSMKLLGLDYLDLYLMHWPLTGNKGETVRPSIRETWEAMERLVDAGLVRSIGVSNFSATKVAAILEYARIRPSVVQVECHPYCRNDALLAFCKEENIHVTAHSPLGSPDSATLLSRDKSLPTVMTEPLVAQLATKYGADVGQVLVRWGMQHGTSVLPKSSDPRRIRSNIEGPVLNFTLNEPDFEALSTLPIQVRSLCGSVWISPRGPYRSVEELWDEPEIRPTEEQLEAAQLRRRKAEYKTVEQEFVQLPGDAGCEMPMLGFGTWKGAPGEIERAVLDALKAGYRHIDCAEYYRNEHEVGAAIAKALGDGVLTREEIFVVSKLWNTGHGETGVRKSCERSLKQLGLDQLDLYLIHWPVTGNVGGELRPSIRETWAAMEQLVEDGLVRSIGVSNFSRVKVAALLEHARIKPSVLQVECHPYCRNSALIRWCAKHDIHVTAHSSLGSPDSATMLRRTGPVLMEDADVREIADRYGKDVGQVLIRYGLDHGTSVLAKSLRPARIASNLSGAFNWDLSEEDYRRLNSLSVQKRMVDGAAFLNPKGPYITLEDLWDTPDGAPDNTN